VREEAPTCGRSFFLRKKPWGLLPPNPHCHSSPATGWGILTFSRKGLGTITAAAALERGFEADLIQINWTCDAYNQGSIHTAKKLGLERIEDYRIALLVMDEATRSLNWR
jgi:RimJ/RimL family protein N-acetyltransferase